MLKCAKCKEYKKEKQFLKQSKRKRGFQYWCKSCANDYNRKYHAGQIEVKKRRKFDDIHRIVKKQKQKLCIVCGKWKNYNGFASDKRTTDKVRAYCKKCKKDNYKERPSLQRKRKKKIKDEVYNAYGGYVCACCGETESLFLTIDHINNDGSKQRKKLKSTASLYYWLKRNNFPIDYQVLCFNCNCGKARNKGICPHKI